MSADEFSYIYLAILFLHVFGQRGIGFNNYRKYYKIVQNTLLYNAEFVFIVANKAGTVNK